MTRTRPRLSHLLFVITVALGVVCAVRGPLPKMSGDIRALMPSSSPRLSDLTNMERLFGEGLFDSIVVSAPERLDDSTLSAIENISDDLSVLDGVLALFSPVEGYSDLGFPLRLRVPENGTARFLVEVDGALSDAQRRELDRSLDAVIADHRELEPIRAGAFSLTEAATLAVEKENAIWTPACIVSLIAVLLFIFRDLRTVATILYPAALTLIWVVAGLLMAEVELSPISALVLPLLLAVSTSYSCYVVARRISAEAAADPQALSGLPLSLGLAAGTTVAGFLSLIPIDVRGVSQFGTVMAIGTVLAAIFSLGATSTFLPGSEESARRIDRSVERFSIDLRPIFRGRIVWVLIVASALLALGISAMKVDTSPYDFLPEGSPQAENFRRAQRAFPGTHALSVVFELKEGGPSEKVDCDALSAAAEELRKIPGAVATVSCGDFLRFDRAARSRGMNDESRNPLGPPSITTTESTATRIIIENDLEGASLLAFNEEVHARIRKILPAAFFDSYQVFSAARELVMAESAAGLSRGLLRSVLAALALVGVLLFFVFRTVRFTVLGLLPSILPIAALFGVLGLALSTVNLGASMVAAVALGMISDNTFHFMVIYKNALRRIDHEQAIEAAFRSSCGAFASTAIVVVIGFAPTMLSDLIPVRQFGEFLAAALFFGLATNAGMLPVLIERRLIQTPENSDRRISC